MTADRPRRWPATFFIGAAVIVIAEGLLGLDIARRGGAVVPEAPLPPADDDLLAQAARWTAAHMTAIAWCGYLLVFEGLLTALAWRRGESAGSCVRRRPWLFVVAYLTSVPVWCYWDWINFYFMDAWRYHGLPENLADRYVSYFLAFAAISPGMFLAAQLYQRLGLAKLRTGTGERAAFVTLCICAAIACGLALSLMVVWAEKLYFGIDIGSGALLLLGPGLAMVVWTRVRDGRPCLYASAMAFGAGWVVYSFAVGNPVGNFVMWASPVFLLDPLNQKLGRPSLLRDWAAGRWGRTIALMAGGLTCGLLWEFWNYWAIAKWTYHLDFLGPLENIRYFEMPVVGLIGFLPFGPACWVMLQTLLLLMPRVTEPLPSDHDVL